MLLRKISQLFVFLLVLFAGLCMTISTHAAITVKIYDQATVLTADELSTAQNVLEEVADKTELKIGILLDSSSRTEYGTQMVAKSTFDATFGEGTNGVLLYIDLSADTLANAYHYVYGSGSGQFYFTYEDGESPTRADTLINAMCVSLYPRKFSLFDTMFEDIASTILALYEKGSPEGYVIYDSDNAVYYSMIGNTLTMTSTNPYGTSYLWIVVLVCSGIGLFIAIVYYGITTSRYAFKSDLYPPTSTAHRKLQFTKQFDELVEETTTKTPKIEIIEEPKQ